MRYRCRFTLIDFAIFHFADIYAASFFDVTLFRHIFRLPKPPPFSAFAAADSFRRRRPLRLTFIFADFSMPPFDVSPIRRLFHHTLSTLRERRRGANIFPRRDALMPAHYFRDAALLSAIFAIYRRCLLLYFAPPPFFITILSLITPSPLIDSHAADVFH
jgi:hypothetical protein